MRKNPNGKFTVNITQGRNKHNQKYFKTDQETQCVMNVMFTYRLTQAKNDNRISSATATH